MNNNIQDDKAAAKHLWTYYTLRRIKGCLNDELYVVRQAAESLILSDEGPTPRNIHLGQVIARINNELASR